MFGEYVGVLGNTLRESWMDDLQPLLASLAVNPYVWVLAGALLVGLYLLLKK